ncbi:hypothetical protein COLO4_21282 [Corchorus olitorius]|uniref:Uncharacterized protein n=1 Tax=Corchorus olitorius TaxID=93759 RepID=A0A1R3IUA9_9ROSI|nr:hypothetical protein COLO4_21282 [Corchorus olitorius]
MVARGAVRRGKNLLFFGRMGEIFFLQWVPSFEMGLEESCAGNKMGQSKDPLG